MIKDIDDGIGVYFAKQGEGKSYVCSHKVVEVLRNPKNKRIVLSNYPIIATLPLSFKQKCINKILSIYKEDTHTFKIGNKEIVLTKQIPKKISSYKWNDEYTRMGVRDKIIVIDESHTKYTGAYAYELSKEDRVFFSVLRHNNNSVIVMSQSYEDIHPFLRKRFAYLCEVRKVNSLFSGKDESGKRFKKPSHFIVSKYMSKKDYINRDAHKLHKKARKTINSIEKIKFTTLVGTSYNTHFYRDKREEPKYISWIDELNITEHTVPIIKPVVQIKLDEQIIKDTIATLMRINRWKKKDAVLEVNRIITEYDISEINTVEKMLRIALSRHARSIEEREQIKNEKEIDGDDIDF